MNILLVEDIESIIKGLTYSLEKSNYKLVIKTTIKDTKEYLLSNTNIDLIILDITLPDGDGFDLFVNTIKNLKIPTIFLTAKDEEDDIVKGVVYNFNPQYGAFVAVNNKYHGLIQMKELTSKVYVGMEVEARVKSVRTDGKLDLALRKKAYLQIDDDARKIIEYMEKNNGEIGYTDKARPEIIKKDFGMSKNEFKRAIGRLLKERRVIIKENSINLIK